MWWNNSRGEQKKPKVRSTIPGDVKFEGDRFAHNFLSPPDLKMSEVADDDEPLPPEPTWEEESEE